MPSHRSNEYDETNTVSCSFPTIGWEAKFKKIGKVPSYDYFTIFLNFMSKEYNTCCPAAHGLVLITVMHIQKIVLWPIQGLLRRMTDFPHNLHRTDFPDNLHRCTKNYKGSGAFTF
jgi:hypothetical protein